MGNVRAAHPRRVGRAQTSYRSRQRRLVALPAGLMEFVRSYDSTNFGLPSNRDGSAPALSLSGLSEWRTTQWALGFPWLYPPFPASCAFRSTMASLPSPPSQTLPCRFPAAGSSGVTPRTRSTSIVVRSVGLPIFGDIGYRGRSLDYVSFRQIRPLVPPLPSRGYRGRSFRKPCGSPPSQ